MLKLLVIMFAMFALVVNYVSAQESVRPYTFAGIKACSTQHVNLSCETSSKAVAEIILKSDVFPLECWVNLGSAVVLFKEARHSCSDYTAEYGDLYLIKNALIEDGQIVKGSIVKQSAEILAVHNLSQDLVSFLQSACE
jgi:hypothetical protein